MNLIRHCFACGNPAVTRFIEGRDRHTCSVCDKVLYQNPHPAAAVLYLQEDRLLLVKRGVAPQKGLWALPAGFQEMDETPEQAARREMHEETGMQAKELKLFDLFFNDHDPTRPINVAVFLTFNAEGHLKPGDDVLDADFFPLNQLPTELAFPYIKECIKKIPLLV